MKVKFFILIIGLNFLSCSYLTGDEVARLRFTKTSDDELQIKDTSLTLKKNDKLSFWTEMDIEYQNDLALTYSIEIWKGSRKKEEIQLDALETNPTFLEVRTSFANKTSWRYTGKIGSIKIKEDGDYTFKAMLNPSGNSTLKLNKAELFFKK